MILLKELLGLNEEAIDEVPLNSSAILDAEYDEATGEMRVRFATNPIATYLFPGVPKEVYDQFIRLDKTKGESPGRFYNTVIKPTYSTNITRLTR
ncbi:MAG: KTSC domain-containing protein [Proteobacteria bacterium]|nr:KTSC domain-containing protein [Pseudomonadota bacterium]